MVAHYIIWFLIFEVSVTTNRLTRLLRV